MGGTRVRPASFTLVALVVLWLAESGCGHSAGGLAPPGSLRDANVLLVTVDTLRRDRVGAFGNRNGLTPNIDRLAATGARFAHAYSPAPLTLPAHASILTGLLPRRHGIHNNTSFRLGDGAPTLAAVLGKAGYRTGAFVGAFVLDGRFGLNRGFDEYDDRLPRGDRATFHYAERRGDEVVARAGVWIAARAAEPGAPWFAWVHLFDPHAPYDAPPEYSAGRAPYDAEVAYTDAVIGRLIGRLDAAHARGNTLVVLTADHGESLGEHGETTHGLFAYDATIAVPLILNAASIAPATVETPVSHVDLAPTILDLVGVAAPPGLDGESAARPLQPSRPIVFEALDASLTRGWAPLRGVVQDGWKYIDLPEPELYDLANDPGETTNRSGDRRAAALKRVLAATDGAETTAPSVALDAEAAGRLRSLGYTAGGSTRRGVTAADDPKRLVALNERFNTALTAFDEGRADQALAALHAILGERPDFTAARTSAATVLVSAGKSRAAVDLLREGLAAEPDSPALLAKLGAALRAAGDLAGATAAFERARRAGNASPDVANDLAVTYAAAGHADQARALFQELADRSPGSATAWFNLGLFELQMRQGSAAAAGLKRATAIDPSYGEAWQALGAALLDVDRPQAIDAWRKAEPLLPGDYDLLFNLGMVLADGDMPREAIPYLERFAREAPSARYAADIARVRGKLRQLERAP